VVRKGSLIVARRIVARSSTGLLRLLGEKVGRPSGRRRDPSGRRWGRESLAFYFHDVVINERASTQRGFISFNLARLDVFPIYRAIGYPFLFFFFFFSSSSLFTVLLKCLASANECGLLRF